MRIRTGIISIVFFATLLAAGLFVFHVLTSSPASKLVYENSLKNSPPYAPPFLPQYALSVSSALASSSEKHIEPPDTKDVQQIQIEPSPQIEEPAKLPLTATPHPSLETSSLLPQDILYKIASNRVVNLFCEINKKEVAVATGVIIHEKGYILTNAHVAEESDPKPCLIRKGSPAHNYAIAERVFSPKHFSIASSSTQNLSRDVAIWKITSLIGELEGPFPYLDINPLRETIPGERLATFSYPAELLGSQTILQALHLSFSETTVTSFDAYFIESEQSIGSQKGSSGGVLMDKYTGEFAGLIFAIGNVEKISISERKLYSLTPYTINETIRQETGKTLKEFLAQSP